MPNKKIVAYLLVAVVLTAIGFYVYHVTAKPKTYYAYFDGVNGLQKASRVFVKGVKKGNVSAIELEPEGIKVIFSIDRDIPVPEDTKVFIASGDVSGEKAIMLSPGKSRNMLPEGSSLQGVIDTSFTESITANLSPILFNVKSSLKVVDDILASFNIVIHSSIEAQTRQGIEDFSETMQQASNTSSRIYQLMNPLSGKITSLEKMTSNASDKNRSVNNTLANADTSLANWSKMDFEKDVTSLKTSMSKLSATIDKLNRPGTGFNKMLTDSSSYHSATRQLHKLDQSLSELEQNPKGLVIFGKKK